MGLSNSCTEGVHFQFDLEGGMVYLNKEGKTCVCVY